MSDELKPCPGYEGLYAVSSDGGVYSLRRRAPRRLSDRRHPRGYRDVHLTDAAGRGASHLVHRLVLTAFVGACPNGFECRHLNGDRGDNRLENLRWGTKAENAADREAHGTVARGERNAQAKLTAEQVAQARKMRSAGSSLRAMARLFGVDKHTISDAVKGRHWSHV